MRENKEAKRQLDKTIALTTGIVGIQVAGAVGAGIPGLPGTIVSGGVMPIAAAGLLEVAANGRTRKRRRKK